MTLLGLSKQGVCWSAQTTAAPATSIPISSSSSVTSRDTETPSSVTAAPSQMSSQSQQRVVLPPEVKQALVNATLRHLHSLSAQSNAQSNSDLQSNLDVRGVSNILYALGSMGCRWRTAKETRARARTKAQTTSTSTKGIGVKGIDELALDDTGEVSGVGKREDSTDNDDGLSSRSMQTAVVDALVAALSIDHGFKGDTAAVSPQSNPQSNLAVSLEDLSHLLHALAHMGFDFQVITHSHHST